MQLKQRVSQTSWKQLSKNSPEFFEAAEPVLLEELSGAKHSWKRTTEAESRTASWTSGRLEALKFVRTFHNAYDIQRQYFDTASKHSWNFAGSYEEFRYSSRDGGTYYTGKTF